MVNITVFTQRSMFRCQIVSYIISYPQFNWESISVMINAKCSSVWTIFPIFFTSYVILIKKIQWNIIFCLSYSSVLIIMHMMIGNPFLTQNKVKWGHPGFFHILLLKGHRRRIYWILYWFISSLHRNLFNNFSGLFPLSLHHK